MKQDQVGSGEIPIPQLPWETVCRLLNNLDYGRPIDPEAWNLPRLAARPDDKADLKLAERLSNAFYRAADVGGSTGDGLWSDMKEAFHRPFTKALEERDFQVIAQTLAGMFHAPLAAGICRRESDPEAFANDMMTRLITIDVVISLGMALGTVRVPNPFMADPPNPLAFDIIPVMENIRDALRCDDFAPPQVGGIFGIEFDGKLYPHKYLYQVYAAHRMRTVLRGNMKSCLEIGGGAGFLAHAAVSIGGATDYCIIDLPIVNMLQGYLLLKSPVSGCVSLYGEKETTDGTGGRRIRVLPDIAIQTLQDRSFDIAVNQDSLPEMESATMEGYLDDIERLTRACFLSINQEGAHTISTGFSHGVVAEAVARRDGFEYVYRMPYWLRPGYVEELFRLTASGTPMERLRGYPRV